MLVNVFFVLFLAFGWMGPVGFWLVGWAGGGGLRFLCC